MVSEREKWVYRNKRVQHKGKQKCVRDDFSCSQWRTRGKKTALKLHVKQGSAGFCVKSQIINSEALWAIPSQSYYSILLYGMKAALAILKEMSMAVF